MSHFKLTILQKEHSHPNTCIDKTVIETLIKLN